MHIRVVHDFTQGERGGIDDEFKKKSNSNFHFCKYRNENFKCLPLKYY